MLEILEVLLYIGSGALVIGALSMFLYVVYDIIFGGKNGR